MNARRKSTKQPVNLSLSADALRQAEQLKKELNRPSISNVVEFLLGEATKSQPQTQEVAA